MKIGITIPYASVNYSGGINVQCRMWQKGLSDLGHECYLLNPWDKFDYPTFDYLIIVGIGPLLYNYVKMFKGFKHPKILSAPVLDPNDMSISKFKFYCKYYGSIKLGIRKPYHDYFMVREDFDFFLVRSEFERKYIIEGLGLAKDKVKVVPISMRFDNIPEIDIQQKEEYCLHISRLAYPGKNVARLIEAAKKYNFRLKLVGTLNGEHEKQWLNSLIENSNNIEYLGWLDEESLKAQFAKAKVLALPSIIEGVGMVALEAAVYGCEICLTSLGGPKEYYEGRAVLVNPYDVDSIGKGVIEAMNNKHAQPELRAYILKKYSVSSCMKQLENFMNEN